MSRAEEESGEEFIVGAYHPQTAWAIAREIEEEIFKVTGIPPELSLEYEMTEEEAEASGLDEY